MLSSAAIEIQLGVYKEVLKNHSLQQEIISSMILYMYNAYPMMLDDQD